MSRSTRAIEARPLLWFFVLTFAWAWGIWLPLGLAKGSLPMGAVLLGAWAPSLSALVLSRVLHGPGGAMALLRRLWVFRACPRWYLFVIFSPAIFVDLALVPHLALGGEMPSPTFPPGVPENLGLVLLPLFFLINIFVGGPIAEELGWRGFAFPRLQEHTSALRASLWIGLIWGIWHIPFFLVPGANTVVGHIPLWAFVLLTTAWSVLYGWVYNYTKGNLVLMVLYHAAINTTLGIFGPANAEANGKGPGLLVLTILVTWLIVGLVAKRYGPGLVRE